MQGTREMQDIPSEEQMLDQQAQQAEMKERRDNILSQILEPEAKTRLVRLALVKPDLVSAVEDTLIRAGTTGQLKGVVTDGQLKKMLEQFSSGGSDDGAGAGQKKVVVQRKKYGVDDSDEDDDDSDLL
jgi:programmed cell death protein 5